MVIAPKRRYSKYGREKVMWCEIHTGMELDGFGYQLLQEAGRCKHVANIRLGAIGYSGVLYFAETAGTRGCTPLPPPPSAYLLGFRLGAPSWGRRVSGEHQRRPGKKSAWAKIAQRQSAWRILISKGADTGQWKQEKTHPWPPQGDVAPREGLRESKLRTAVMDIGTFWPYPPREFETITVGQNRDERSCAIIRGGFLVKIK
ncbi:hypothetical protein DFH06DRAFT_1140477 [Mycena polygramma]|nr:hypothetical protein DFH06DRAFT_1140477 [Mycena polygramma]